MNVVHNFPFYCHREAYSLVQSVLQARQLLTPEHTDLGLGGVLLEGASGIGKSHFLDQLEQGQKEKVYRISASTPYAKKEEILTLAFKQGAIVFADEINTSLWPHELLNSYLMGVDPKGKPPDKPGFMLIATQNPGSFKGRLKEDTALFHRMIKLNVNWPKYKAPSLLKAPILFKIDDDKKSDLPSELPQYKSHETRKH